jgi:hypothetical protein
MARAGIPGLCGRPSFASRREAELAGQVNELTNPQDEYYAGLRVCQEGAPCPRAKSSGTEAGRRPARDPMRA